MTAIPVGTVVKDLATQQQFVVVGYRSEDDTIMASDAQATRMVRLDASHTALIVSHRWDSDVAQSWHQTLRNRLLDHVGRPTHEVALMVSDQLDHMGEAWPL